MYEVKEALTLHAKERMNINSAEETINIEQIK
jgi:hypothetical protein